MRAGRAAREHGAVLRLDGDHADALLAALQHLAHRAAGVAADIYSKYRIDLKYTGYFGNYSTNPATGAATTFNGVFGSLSDRGWWSLTFKTTF